MEDEDVKEGGAEARVRAASYEKSGMAKLNEGFGAARRKERGCGVVLQQRGLLLR